MLISAKFNGFEEFNMLSKDETKQFKRLIRLKNYKLRLSNFGVLLGGHGSGKSKFLKRFIKLKSVLENDTRGYSFCNLETSQITCYLNGIMYSFYIELNNFGIKKEVLKKITTSGREIVLFERNIFLNGSQIEVQSPDLLRFKNTFLDLCKKAGSFRSIFPLIAGLDTEYVPIKHIKDIYNWLTNRFEVITHKDLDYPFENYLEYFVIREPRVSKNDIILNTFYTAINFSQLEKTLIIDDFGESLEFLAVKYLFEYFLNNVNLMKTQIILSTHHTDLLNCNFIRNDEFWFVEKNKNSDKTKLTNLATFSKADIKLIKKLKASIISDNLSTRQSEFLSKFTSLYDKDFLNNYKLIQKHIEKNREIS